MAKARNTHFTFAEHLQTSYGVKKKVIMCQITACLKWEKRFLAWGFPIFLGRWSDQTFLNPLTKPKQKTSAAAEFLLKPKIYQRFL